MYNEHLTIVTPKLGMVYKVISWEVARTIQNDPEDYTDVYIYDGDNNFTIVNNDSEIDKAQEDNENKAAAIFIGTVNAIQKSLRNSKLLDCWKLAREVALDWETATGEDAAEKFDMLKQHCELYDNYTMLDADMQKVEIDGCVMHVESIHNSDGVPTVHFDGPFGNFDVRYEDLSPRAMEQVLDVVKWKFMHDYDILPK